MSNAKGFHVVELLIVVVVVAAVGLVGYAVWNKDQKNKDAQTTTQPTTAEIKSQEDLDAASASVDELDAADGEADLNSIEQELNAL
jgi:predicted negative regulator of RcsB-dependent stress response